MRTKKIENKNIEPLEQQFTVGRARSLFLEAIKKNAPNVLESLAENARYDISLKLLENWAKSWNIEFEWILEIAYETLLSFKEFPLYLEDVFEFSMNDILQKQRELSLPSKIIEDLNIKPNENNLKISFGESSFLIEKLLQAKIPFRQIKRELFWSFVFSTYEIPEASKLPKPPKGLPVWNAHSEPFNFYLSKVENLINKELEEGFFSDTLNKGHFKKDKLSIVENYCDAVLKTYENLKDLDGKPLWMRTNEKLNLERGAIWSIKFQVLNQDFSKIASDENVVHTTVSREVEKFLELIGLEKKNTKRGRRKGSKNSILATLGR